MDVNKLLPSDPSWVKDGLILLGKVGSHAYGTATETSDLDFKGVVVPPVDYFLGLNSFNGYDKSGGKNFKNTAEDVDVTLIHINKFVADAMAGVPNNIELLFLDDSDYVYSNPYGDALIGVGREFLSKKIMYKFGGYAKSQAQKMQNLKSNGAARTDLVEQYGYDTKFYMHTVRLLQMAIDILDDPTGFKTKRKNADYLIALRKGEHTLEQALSNIEQLEQLLQTSFAQSRLKDEPDFEYINRWLTNFNYTYINKK